MKTKIAIFASGNGSNAEEIIRFFKDHPLAEVALVLSNNKSAYVLRRAWEHSIPHCFFTNDDLRKTTKVDEVLKLNGINFIVLAGFMLLVPARFVKNYPNRIVNIHPALLPKYGGKGMYGEHVHKAVIANGEKETGITIHLVNDKYDEGAIVFQATCAISPGDTPESVAAKVHQLEHHHYPRVIAKLIKEAPPYSN